MSTRLKLTKPIRDKAKIDVFPFYSEVYECPQCENPIPGHNLVKGRLVGGDHATHLTRTVSALCPHCKSGWRAAQVLENNIWHTAGGIEKLDTEDLAKLVQAVNLITGAIQRPRAA